MPGKREIQKANRRNEILRAAMDLFSKKGFELTTVEDITRQAHVAKGTFYNFFPKKEDVLLYFLDTEFGKSIDEIQRKMPRLSTISEKIELLIATYIKYIFPNKEFSSVLIKERVMNLGTGSNRNELNLMRQLAGLFDDAKQRGEIRDDIDSGHLAEMVFAIYTMYVIYWTNGFIKTKKQCVKRIREVSQLMLQGVARDHR
ncbi:MAG: TetR/AcrR family transcriptional regulator [Deltaproteobacteria bacterium]|nr:TetR/AcrR family transcriptional regulator [Deltaproteobacteria bacterium]